MARKRMKWFGVRTLVRLVASGRPKQRDKHFNPATTLVEDRVVLFRATDFDDALAQGEKEAREYCRRTRHKNIYGQSVRMKLLECTHAFEIADEEPNAGTEVYSSTALAPASTSDAKILLDRLGKTDAAGSEARFKFIDATILRKALEALDTE